MVLIDNEVRNYNEPLDQSNERKHTDKKSKSRDRSTTQQTYKCKVLSKMVRFCFYWSYFFYKISNVVSPGFGPSFGEIVMAAESLGQGTFHSLVIACLPRDHE